MSEPHWALFKKCLSPFSNIGKRAEDDASDEATKIIKVVIKKFKEACVKASDYKTAPLVVACTRAERYPLNAS